MTTVIIAFDDSRVNQHAAAMTNVSETRDRMIEAAAWLFQRRGYHGVGLMDIVREGAAPRGSIYHHFPGGKEELAVEAVQSGSRRITELFERTAERSSLAADLVLEIGRELAGGLEESGFVEGCPLATVTLETAPASEALRAACEAAYADWLRVLSELLLRHGVPFERSQSLAMLTLGAWGGALVISRARCDTEPLRLITSELAELVGREAGQR